MMEEKIKSPMPGWRIIRAIGRGSYGTVYEVEKDDGYGEGIRSALKVISIPETPSEIEAYRDDGYDDASLTALYKSRVEDITAEFRLMNKLKGCNNIVSYEDHTIVQHDHDIGYDIMIRMELLTSLPKYIDQRLVNNPDDEKTVRKLGADICRALERCARHNIIHRDIKPQNIFVNEEGDFKLGDFGIAKTSDHTTKATKTGTYGYMAPEVYWGKPYNASVDIYSLGLVLYWLLNERRGPFLPLPPQIPTTQQATEALERRMHGDALPAPKHGSEELKRIVLKACAYNPKDRYTSPTEMRQDLERVPGAKIILPVHPIDRPNPDTPLEETIGVVSGGAGLQNDLTVSAHPNATKESPAADADTTEDAKQNQTNSNRETLIKTDSDKKRDNDTSSLPCKDQESDAKGESKKKQSNKRRIFICIAAILAALIIALIIILGNGRVECYRDYFIVHR